MKTNITDSISYRPLTIEDAKRKVKVMEAWIMGAEIQFKPNGSEAWEIVPSPTWDWNQYDYRINFIEGSQLTEKLSLPPIPDGATIHNPDNLTPEQVGDGFRLCVLEEKDGRHRNVSDIWLQPLIGWKKASISQHPDQSLVEAHTYRVPASTPYPAPSNALDALSDSVEEIEKEEPAPEPLQLHGFYRTREGKLVKLIESNNDIGILADDGLRRWPNGRWDSESKDAKDIIPALIYLDRFPEKEWHLPKGEKLEDYFDAGMRPLKVEEKRPKDYERLLEEGWRIGHSDSVVTGGIPLRCPIQTPITFPEEPKPVEYVQLEPEDIKPTDVFRNLALWRGTIWAAPSFVSEAALQLQHSTITWSGLMLDGWEISHDGGITWLPCRKEAP